MLRHNTKMEVSSSALLPEGSSAYQESARLAKASGKWTSPTDARPAGGAGIGLRTMVTVTFLMLAGTVLLLSGLVFFFTDQNKDHRGLGMLVVAGICLVPGTFGLISWVGASRGWEGYSYTLFNLD